MYFYTTGETLKTLSLLIFVGFYKKPPMQIFFEPIIEMLLQLETTG